MRAFRSVCVLAVFLAAVPAFASEPGQPLDCSDWVFQPPGYSCGLLPLPSSVDCGAACPLGSGGAVVISTDNSGALIFVQRDYSAGGPSCGSGLLRTALVRYDGQAAQVLGYIDERCSNSTLSMSDKFSTDAVRPSDSPGLVRFIFDDKNGRVLIPFETFCYESNVPYNFCYDNPGYGSTAGYFVISGLARAFDIFQSYVPPSGPLTFRVPAMPDGLGGAEHFDTYWGTLSTVGDWSQAHPLQCGYPSSPPHVGDYLTVNDTLPNPVVGRGRYYVTAATYQGQIRFGRKGTRGHLTGRDPSQLPACVQP